MTRAAPEHANTEMSEQDAARLIDEVSPSPSLAARVHSAAAEQPTASLTTIARDTVMDLDEAALLDALSGVDPFRRRTDVTRAENRGLARLEELAHEHEERFGVRLVLAREGRDDDALAEEAVQRLALADRAQALAAAQQSLADILAWRIRAALAPAAPETPSDG
ncbi:2-oxo-4-hydroxy-4-carboxy-5-ureidoimidazoline decarboxylase [Microbacterium sp. ASV81]|uniref:2-oxo-4-hydroxy-4-carboxy-5-ureidoimidazoline decarboxylase n=1 Tax=Microbacterium capsulatum TaxID=3041921 RepID=A0ABU0XEN6_9MICO|nr:2-oxo-4-hydroxy-4-carboxy-5-ureidoimidazoline decarboxylase [Microbacterium sp. ASV81]MDQ4213579.1 2-oxo-4-hydroxy-4-carboxy-5-ureidoimidazoline decarboxylase [Microbacterium sp. ASV81]